MNISDAAARTGLPVKTIRYYEEIGLVAPGRSANGYRAFCETDLHKLAFVGRGRALGFSVDECRDLLRLYDDKARASGDVKRIAEAHLREIDRKLNELGEMRRTLATLVSSCAGDDRPDCPILEGMAGKG